VKIVKLRLTQDCEHGEKGKILDVEDYRVPAFMAEGRVEMVSPKPLVVHPGEEVEIVPKPRQPVEVKVAKPAAKPTKRPRK
jgi:hypothetical protein